MTIKEIIQKLHITMIDAGGQESHFQSWLTLSEGIIDVIDALKALDKQEPVAWMFQHDETGRMNYVSNDGIHDPTMFLGMNPRYALVCPLYTTPPQIEVGCAECGVGNHHALYCVACAEKFVGEAATKLQQKQETIEGLNRDYDLLFAEHQLLLKKEWVGLTLDDIPDDDTNNLDFYRGGKWAERILKEKNT